MSDEKAVPEMNVELANYQTRLWEALGEPNTFDFIRAVKALTAEVDALKAQLATAKQVAEDALTWEQEDRHVLKGRLERLEAPVSMDEIPVGERIGAAQFNRIILARATPQSAEKIGGGA